MFAVVTLDSARRPGALLRRCLRRFEIEQIPAGEKWFYLIHHSCPPGRPNWRRLCRLLGRERYHLLYPVGLTPPPGLDIRRYDTSAFYARTLTGVFCEVLRSQPRPPGPAALIDREATLQQTAEQLLPLTPQLIIYTRHPRRYEAFLRRAELSYGVSPILSESARPLQRAAAVLAPYGAGGLPLPARAVLFGRAEDDGYYLSDACLSPPPEVLEQIPPGISTLEMLAALHEKCGLPLPPGEICPALCKGGGKSSVGGLVFTISCLT